MDNHDITDACIKHGAQKVYAAANARIAGNHAPLLAVGLSAATIGDADRIGRAAFALLSAVDLAADLADAAIKGAKL